MKWRERISEGGGPYIALMLRLYLGGVFLYASTHKINHAGEFAETIASYQLVPFWAVNAVALLLPWTEFFSGLMLIVGLRTRAAAALIAGMLVVFIVAVSINLFRGAPIDCGCFRALEDPISWQTVVRDLVWLAMALFICRVDSALQLER
jgi:uncharacterized membrane protein YphA (DoxX/SURF4 family)